VIWASEGRWLAVVAAVAGGGEIVEAFVAAVAPG
jgi:hypothetical protein